MTSRERAGEARDRVAAQDTAAAVDATAALDAAAQCYLACFTRAGSANDAPQRLADVEALLARGARGCDDVEGSDVDCSPLLRCLLAHSAQGEALAMKLLEAAADVRPSGRAASLAVAAASGASVRAPKVGAGPAFATLAELARRGCTADATEALHTVLRALPIGRSLRDDGRALDVVRALLAAGADAAAPVLQGGQCMNILSLVGDVAIGEELAALGAHRGAQSLCQLVGVPLQQPPSYLSFLHDMREHRGQNSIFSTQQIERLIDRAMDCRRPYDCNRLDALEFLQDQLIRGGGSLRSLRRMLEEARVSRNVGTFQLLLSRVCVALHPACAPRCILSDDDDGTPFARFVRLLLDSEEQRIYEGLAQFEADENVDAEGARVWWESLPPWQRRRAELDPREKAAADRAFMKLVLDAGGVTLPRGVEDLQLAASMLIDAVVNEAHRSGDAVRPMHALLHTLAAAAWGGGAGDSHAISPSCERWQAAGVAVQAALNAHAAMIDAREARTARAAAQANATCISNWAAMRALVTNLEAAMTADDEMAASAAAAMLQKHRRALHVARGLCVAADKSAALRSRLGAAVAAVMRSPDTAASPATNDDSVIPAAAEHVLTLRGACGGLVSVRRAPAICASEYLATAVAARWGVGGDQPIAVAELSAADLRCFAAFISGVEPTEHDDNDAAWEAAARAAPSSVDWAALERAAARAAGASVKLPRQQRAQRMLQALVMAGALGAVRMQLAAALAAAAAALGDDASLKRNFAALAGTEAPRAD